MRLKRLSLVLMLVAVCTVAAGTVVAGAQVPLEGLQLWLRADQGVEVADGALVRWEDQSPAGNHAVADEGISPILVESVLAGYPVVRFDGEDDYLRIAHADGLNAVEGFTTFAVFRYEDPGLRLAQKKNGTAGNDADAWYINPRGGLAVAGVRHKQRPFETGIFLLQTSVLDLERGVLEIFKNGESVALESPAKAQQPNEDDLLIGKREHSAGQHLVGDVAELIIYNRTLSADEILAVEAYLQEKYFKVPEGAPVVVLLGDSIRRGYQADVVEILGDEVQVLFPEENNRYTTFLLESLADYMRKWDPDVVHVNAGLHDLWIDGSTNRVPVEAYAENLRTIIATIREHTDATIIWATTTPVIDARVLASSGRQGYSNDDVIRYNEAAIAVMEEQGVMINDLYTIVTGLGPEKIMSTDGVHFNPIGNRVLGVAVAELIQSVLAQ